MMMRCTITPRDQTARYRSRRPAPTLGSSLATERPMARKAIPSPPPSAAAAPPAPPRERAVDALMRLAADRPWNDIEITDIAEEAGLTLAEFRDLFPSKGAVLGAFSRTIDKKVLAGTSEDLAGEP